MNVLVFLFVFYSCYSFFADIGSIAINIRDGPMTAPVLIAVRVSRMVILMVGFFSLLFAVGVFH